jgi:hypothetical protein
MDKILLRLLRLLWIRRARHSYGGIGDNGEMFTTAGVQRAAEATGILLGERTVHELLRGTTWRSDPDGQLWFRSSDVAQPDR